MIIHIDGVQGSGKSYICGNINNKSVLCIDTDDIMKKAIAIIEKSQKTNNRMPRTVNQFKKVKRMLVNNIIEHNKSKLLVFVGMTAEVPKPNYKFFIKIQDFVGVYKRLLLRELDKIIKNEKKIRKHVIAENDPTEIDIQRIADMSLIFPVDYKAFKKDYNERLKDARRRGYIPKTQEQIINFINEL